MPIELPPSSELAATATGYRTGGTYLVIGGAGGLGQAWTEYLVRTYQAQVIWVGRRPLTPQIAASIQRLAAFGPAPAYLTADACVPDQLRHARDVAEARFGPVNGVVHAALELLDGSVAQMPESRFADGYDAKLRTAISMSQAFAGAPLDFMLFFSSVASFAKPAGQANYAAGCVAADACAHWLASRCRYPVKIVNWGYWGSVGVVAGDGYRERMAGRGMGSIEPGEGMTVLEFLLRVPVDQLVYARADAEALPFIDRAERLELYLPPDGAPSREAEGIRARLRELVTATTGLAIAGDDDRRELADYGIGPGALSALASAIADEFRVNVGQSIFIDHPTLPEVAAFLAGATPDVPATGARQ
jgi:NADP-dependent 3-hydroxy acid dehydrogenase YdfG